MKMIIEAIKIERELQNKKWGEQNHHPIKWITILSEEIGEAAKAALEHEYLSDDERKTMLNNYRKELVSIAAVAIAAIESVNRNELY